MPVSTEISPHPADATSRHAVSRAAILDAAEAIMQAQGHAAVSSRRVARVAGLKSKLVHYYFHTMDALFLALLRRVEQRYFASLDQALAAPDPLRALWALSIEPQLPRLHKEFIALATHRDELRQEIARSAEHARSVHAEVFGRVLAQQGQSRERFPPVALAIVLDGVARVIGSDRALGTTLGHAEAIALVERIIGDTQAAT